MTPDLGIENSTKNSITYDCSHPVIWWTDVGLVSQRGFCVICGTLLGPKFVVAFCVPAESEVTP